MTKWEHLSLLDEWRMARVPTSHGCAIIYACPLCGAACDADGRGTHLAWHRELANELERSRPPLGGFAVGGDAMSDVRRSIIGHAKEVRTAILAVAWLRERLCTPHGPVEPARVDWDFTDSGGVDIYVAGDLDRAKGELDLEHTSHWVTVCRAFVAGAGDYW